MDLTWAEAFDIVLKVALLEFVLGLILIGLVRLLKYVLER